MRLINYKLLVIISVLLVSISQVSAISIIHREGTDKTYNRYLVSLIPEEIKQEIDTIDFDYVKGNNNYCGYYTFWYDLANNRQYSNKITIYCKLEFILWHEIGHHIEQKTYNVINLNETYANNYANKKVIK